MGGHSTPAPVAASPGGVAKPEDSPADPLAGVAVGAAVAGTGAPGAAAAGAATESVAAGADAGAATGSVAVDPAASKPAPIARRVGPEDIAKFTKALVSAGDAAKAAIAAKRTASVDSQGSKKAAKKGDPQGSKKGDFPKAANKKRAYNTFGVKGPQFPYHLLQGAIMVDEPGKRYKSRPGPGMKERSFSFAGPGREAAWSSAQDYIINGGA